MEGTTDATTTTTLTTTTITPQDTCSELPDLSTSYDELMQTVLWVPPSDSALRDDDGVKNDTDCVNDRKEKSNAREGEDRDGLQEEVEATESARDVKSRLNSDVQSRLNSDAKSKLNSDAKSKLNSDVTLRINSDIEMEQSKPTAEELPSSDDMLLDPPSFASLERNVFEMSEKFRKSVMEEMESMKGSFCTRQNLSISTASPQYQLPFPPGI